MIDLWRYSSWGQRLRTFGLVVLFIIGLWLCYLGTGFNFSGIFANGPRRASNEYCRTETEYNYGFDPLTGEYDYHSESHVVCITPIPH